MADKRKALANNEERRQRQRGERETDDGGGNGALQELPRVTAATTPALRPPPVASSQLGGAPGGGGGSEHGAPPMIQPRLGDPDNGRVQIGNAGAPRGHGSTVIDQQRLRGQPSSSRAIQGCISCGEPATRNVLTIPICDACHRNAFRELTSLNGIYPAPGGGGGSGLSQSQSQGRLPTMTTPPLQQPLSNQGGASAPSGQNPTGTGQPQGNSGGPSFPNSSSARCYGCNQPAAWVWQSLHVCVDCYENRSAGAIPAAIFSPGIAIGRQSQLDPGRGQPPSATRDLLTLLDNPGTGQPELTDELEPAPAPQTQSGQEPEGDQASPRLARPCIYYHGADVMCIYCYRGG